MALLPRFLPSPAKTSGSRILRAGLLIAALAVTGCGGEPSPGDGPEGTAASAPGTAAVTPERWTLSASPLLEIGVREGEEVYQLFRVRGSVRLDDGGIAVLNGGSQEIRFFDPSGSYLRFVGGEGEGPGEFESPRNLRRSTDGMLQVFDDDQMLLSRFDLQGNYLESSRLMATREELFPGDDWVYGENWMVTPVPPAARGPVREAVDRLPPADSESTLRLVRLTPQGRLWVSPKVRPPAPEPVDWEVYDLQGKLVARVTTPARFLPHEIGEDYMTGLFLDDLDVNYVRVYALEKPEGSPPGPGLAFAAGIGWQAVAETSAPAVPDEVRAELSTTLKVMASLEEIYYSQNYSYTTDTDELFRDPRNRPPEGIEVQVFFADTDGWAVRSSHPETGGQCIMAYGYYVPMGWRPGAVICL